jgi:hypothetical protein
VVALHKKALKAAEVLDFFITRNYSFDNSNLTAFVKAVNLEDRMVSGVRCQLSDEGNHFYISTDV